MDLKSPRFRNERELWKVDAGHSTLTVGSKGRHVHLVQMALIDLGFAMPDSTKSLTFSPDGDYGKETAATVHRFQKSTKVLAADGVVGHKTLRELDRRIGGFRHRVGLHFRSIALTDASFDRILSAAQEVYAQYGIRIDMMNGESLLLNAAEQANLEKIDQDCDWDLSTGEFNELHSKGAPAPSTDVLVYFIKTFKSATLNGCGGHAKGRPACTVAAKGTQWTVAHEVGHVLLGSSFAPVHVSDIQNLMNTSTNAITSRPTLTVKQLAQMRSSPLLQRV